MCVVVSNFLFKMTSNGLDELVQHIPKVLRGWIDNDPVIYLILLKLEEILFAEHHEQRDLNMSDFNRFSK